MAGLLLSFSVSHMNQAKSLEGQVWHRGKSDCRNCLAAYTLTYLNDPDLIMYL
jgi:hypothetical protein